MSSSRKTLLLTSHPIEGHDGADKELALALASHAGMGEFIWFGRVWPGADRTVGVGVRKPIVSRRGMPGLAERAQVAAWTMALEHRVDITHAIFSVGGLSGLYAWLRATAPFQARNHPVIHTIPGISNPGRFRSQHAVGLPVALSEYTANLLRVAGLADTRVILPGVDLCRWPVTSPVHTSDPPGILTVGHYRSGDGFEQTFRTAALLEESGFNATWLLAVRRRRGNQLFEAGREIIEKTESLGIRNVEIYGRSDMGELIRSASLLLFVPKAHYISSDIPLSVLEAMATGRPVVVSDLPAFAELGDGVERVPVGDIAATAEIIRRLLGSEGYWEEMAWKGRQRIEERFTAERMVQEYEALYEEVLEDPGRYDVRPKAL